MFIDRGVDKEDIIFHWYIYTMDLEIIMLSEVSQTVRYQLSNAITYMWNLKKGHNELVCRTDTDSQTLKTLWFPKETVQGVGDALGLWDGYCIKSDCDDHCTIINVINSLSKKKKENPKDSIQKQSTNSAK